MKKNLTLLCNSHIDPVWLWTWEEGMAEALSTFRLAASFCENHEGFVFNHNEALLYECVEKYEPDLFERIRQLVNNGRWNILGGWYLQPDCNMPCGEAMVRQILRGREYFLNRFGSRTVTAANLDSFGHSRGLVQIMKKSGYKYYLFCRPPQQFLNLPSSDFTWTGYDGSSIIAHRADEHYNSETGKAAVKINAWINEHPSADTGLVLWGIGNHGGGPSLKDLNDIDQLRKKDKTWIIKHGTPEMYFSSIEKEKLPLWDQDLNPWAAGCYTSMSGIKQLYRQLENNYFLTEKMVTAAAIQKLFPYPSKELNEALDDLLFVQFHDAIAGTSIEPVERELTMRIYHALKILNRLRIEVLLTIIQSEKQTDTEPVSPGEFPVFILNPHPFDISQEVTYEIQLPEAHTDPRTHLKAFLYDSSGNILSCQFEKEYANIPNYPRKRIVFHPLLKASSLNRFSCYLKEEEKPGINLTPETGMTFIYDNTELSIDPNTGLVESYVVSGVPYLEKHSFRMLVMEDTADPWGIGKKSFLDCAGEFTLMTPSEAAGFSGIKGTLNPVRIIEQGPVRTVVEALLKYHHSKMVIRYYIPFKGDGFSITLTVYWDEKDLMLKMQVPTPFKNGLCLGEVMYGAEWFGRSHEELVAQKWIMMTDAKKTCALGIINEGTYGFDHGDGVIHLSLLRSPAYAALPVDETTPTTPADRFEPRMDQGPRSFRFHFTAGFYEDQISRIGREAQVKNEPPTLITAWPRGSGKKCLPAIALSDAVIVITAFYLKDEHIIIRLFEPTGKKRMTTLSLPVLDLRKELSFQPFEIKTLALDPETRTFTETDLCGDPV